MPARRPHSHGPLPAAAFLFLVSFVVGLVPVAASRAGEASLPSVSAEHVRHHAPSGIELSRVRIELSPAGLRAREPGGGQDLEIFQDFDAERLWFVDRMRRIVHEVPLDTVFDTVAADDVPVAGHLLGVVPCETYVAHAVGERILHGRSVSRWECRTSDRRTVAHELVDLELGIVVRRETVDGMIDELRGIRERTFAPGHFSPPSRFRRVDARELVLGAPAIMAFDEGASARLDVTSTPDSRAGLHITQEARRRP